MDNITEDEIHGIISYGIRLRNALHRYFFEGIGYEASACIVDKVLEEYHRQIDNFIEEEDRILSNPIPRKAEVSPVIQMACSLSSDEYNELIDYNEAYGRRLNAFCDVIKLEAIARKHMQLKHEIEGNFCTDAGEKRTFYNYNANLFVFDRDRLASEIRKCLDIIDEDLPVYVHDFNAFVNDYASITDMLKKGFPY